MTGQNTSSVQAQLIAFRAGELPQADLLNALMAQPIWLVPLANNEPGSLRPRLLVSKDGTRALPLYSDIECLVEAGWADTPYCELAGAKAFGPHGPDIDAIVIDSASAGWIRLRNDQCALIRSMVASAEVRADPEFPAQVLHALAEGDVIEAIVALRAAEPGLALAPAKQRIDEWLMSPAAALPPSVTAALHAGQRLRAVQELARERSVPAAIAQRLIEVQLLRDLDLRERYLASCGLTEVIKVSYRELHTAAPPAADSLCQVYARLPQDWLAQGPANVDLLDALWEAIYGAQWRQMGAAGTPIQISDIHAEILDADTRGARPWLRAQEGPGQRLCFARAMADGGFALVAANAF